MIKEYKVSEHNSTVCGYPGRDFDWLKFDWASETYHDFGDQRYPLGAKRMGKRRAPKVFQDGVHGGIEYLHVPFNWPETAQIFRVRPNETMWPGRTYRGLKIKTQRAILKKDGWYWQLEGAT